MDYTSIVLDSFRTNVFDAIMVYGFTIGTATTGIVKAKLKILDGLRLVPNGNFPFLTQDLDQIFSDWQSWSSCSKTCDSGIMFRTRSCSYDSGAFESAGGKLREEQPCNPHSCSKFHEILIDNFTISYYYVL